MFQRFCDIILSLVAISLLSPLLILVMLILCITGERKIFFIQKRIGRSGAHFGVLKFATMLENSPKIGSGTITVKNDPRILPFGKFLRKTKINELPQLINILKGDMSLIGPRPLTSQTFDSYPIEVHKKILSVSPGLSGVGSIIFRDEENLIGRAKDGVVIYKQTIAPYKGELECWYIENKSIKIYFSLIILTLYVVIFPKSRLIWRVLPNLPEPPELLKVLR